MPDAMVHYGFYHAYLNTTLLRPAILDAVRRAKKFYGDLQIIVTGHSMGGAMAAFCGLDLTLGHPASCETVVALVGKWVGLWWKVWHYSMGFGSLVYKAEKICDSSGEDPSCTMSVSGNSISDHLIYFGATMHSENAACRFMMDPHVLGYSLRDQGGNLIFSRGPAASLLELSTDLDVEI